MSFVYLVFFRHLKITLDSEQPRLKEKLIILSLRWNKKFWTFPKRRVFFWLCIRIVSWFWVQFFTFFGRAELKPACILLVVYGCFFYIPRFLTFAEPALLDPCLLSKTQQLWIKKVDANPCRWELWSNNRTSNRNLARATKRKLLEYYYRTWHKLAVIKQMPLHIRLNPSTVTPPFPFDNLKYMKEGQTGWTR